MSFINYRGFNTNIGTITNIFTWPVHTTTTIRTLIIIFFPGIQSIHRIPIFPLLRGGHFRGTINSKLFRG